MSVLLITYDYQRTRQKQHALLDVIRQYKYVQLSEGSYAIETFEATRTVYNKLTPYLENDTHMFILTITKPFCGRGVEDVKNWLGNHLPQY